MGEGDKWRLLVDLIQAIWTQGKIPQQLTWEFVVLLPKGGGDYRWPFGATVEGGEVHNGPATERLAAS